MKMNSYSTLILQQRVDCPIPFYLVTIAERSLLRKVYFYQRLKLF